MGQLLVVSRRSRRGWRGPAARSRAAYGETGRTRADLAREVGQDAVEGDGPEVLAAPVPEADGPVLALPLAHDEHVRDLPELRLADPVAELLVAVVELRPQARSAELLPDGPSVRGVFLAHRQDTRLHRREPRRERARVMLGEHPDEPREGLVPVADQLEERGNFVLELVGATVDVRVVLRELPHAEEARQGAGALVPVQPTHVGEAQREVTVRAQRVAIDEGGLRAVHRLETEDLVFRLHEEHVLAEVLPVPRLLPELLVDEDRRRDLRIAARIERLADEPLELAHDRPAVGQPERRARRHLVEDKEIELAPELAVVALLRLLQAPDVTLELLLREPRGAVDPLEHRVPLVAAPVGARGREELEVLHLARRADVRAAAEVDELPLAVERHARGAEPFEDLDLA